MELTLSISLISLFVLFRDQMDENFTHNIEIIWYNIYLNQFKLTSDNFGATKINKLTGNI